jgi:hypothetical protein
MLIVGLVRCLRVVLVGRLFLIFLIKNDTLLFLIFGYGLGHGLAPSEDNAKRGSAFTEEPFFGLRVSQLLELFISSGNRSEVAARQQLRPCG